MHLIYVLILSSIVTLPLSAEASDTGLVPDKIVQAFLEEYTIEEKEKIVQDYGMLSALAFQGHQPDGSLLYLATAGGPGSSKSTTLENYRVENNLDALIYVDPDQRALRLMVHTYLSEMSLYKYSKAASPVEALEKTYEKWRAASNYIANSILNEAFKNKRSIAHGTTSTSKAMGSFYEKLKKAGYTIHLLLCVSPDDNRIRAIDYRANTQAFVQSNRNDVIQKGGMFYDNFPVYFKWADTIDIFFVEGFSKRGTPVAMYSKDKGVKVYSQEALEKVKHLYDTYRMEKNNGLPLFDDLTAHRE